MLEEVRGDIRPSIQTHCWKRQPITHRYPIGFKVLAVQEVIVIELFNTIEIPKHKRVYPLSNTATDEYNNFILNPVTGSMME